MSESMAEGSPGKVRSDTQKLRFLKSFGFLKQRGRYLPLYNILNFPVYLTPFLVTSSQAISQDAFQAKLTPKICKYTPRF